MTEEQIEIFATQIKKSGALTKPEALAFLAMVSESGLSDRAKASLLFKLNKALADQSIHWDRFFIQHTKNYILQKEMVDGILSSETSDWIIANVVSDGAVEFTNEVDLLVETLKRARGAPVGVSRFVLSAACEKIKTAGKALSDDIDRVRNALFLPSGDQGLWVTGREATILFETNDAIAFAKNDSKWNDLFSRAIANHLLSRAHPDVYADRQLFAREKWLDKAGVQPFSFAASMLKSFADGSWFERVTYDPQKAEHARLAAVEAAERKASTVEDEEVSWLMQRLGWDKKISPAERALVEFLQSEIPGFSVGLSVAA